MPTVNIRGLQKKFGQFEAVRNATMSVGDGEYVSIIGPSGCGKTTLLRMIAGILRQDSGDIEFDGQLVNDRPIEERGVGYVFQDIALFPNMNIWENVSYGPRAKGEPADHVRTVTLEMLEMMKLSDRYRDPPSNLSGGMQQKAAVARAIAHGNRLMLLDEPLSMLDARVRSELRFELRRIVKDLGLTAIHVTHDQEEAMAISDRIFVMRAGILIENGSPSDLYFRPMHLFTAYFLGESNIFPGTMEESDEDGCIVRIGQKRLRATGMSGERGSKVAIVIRPELAEIDGEVDDNRIEGRVRARYFEGPFLRYVVEMGDHLFLRVKTRVDERGHAYHFGDQLSVAVKRDHVRVYEFPAGGLNKEIRG
ncbi:MAG TPA: ABC transporter ATP-binding protein [Thermoproteota archaeon]|nr:ABC transporter ATP-binding protein [Thermoproteota archaeon]